MKPVELPPLLERLFGADRYAFQFGMHRAGGDWFDPAGSDPAALEERARLLRESPETCRVWAPGTEEVFAEAASLFTGFEAGASDPESLSRLSSIWEPDFVLLRRADDGDFRLVGGAVCFPSSWDVREKVGLDVTAIHGVVPGLNAALGARIRTFLGRLPSEGVFERENWGLAAHGERNAHPELGRPRLGPHSRVDNTWLRLEHQAFRALPASEGILFVIRLTVHPLSEVLAIPGVRGNLRRHLETMPDEVAVYKGIEPGRASLVEALRHWNDGSGS